MYLHLGQSVVVPFRDIVGIFDLDNASWSHRTRAFLDRAAREGRVENASADLPKSFILCKRGEGPGKVYLSQLAPATLRGRVESGAGLSEETGG